MLNAVSLGAGWHKNHVGTERQPWPRLQAQYPRTWKRCRDTRVGITIEGACYGSASCVDSDNAGRFRTWCQHDASFACQGEIASLFGHRDRTIGRSLQLREGLRVEISAHY